MAWTGQSGALGGTLRDVAGSIAVGHYGDLRIFDGQTWVSLAPPAADIDHFGAVEQLDDKHYLIAGRKTDGLAVYTLTLP